MGFAKELYTEHYYKNLVLGAKDWQEGDVRIEHKKLLAAVDLKGASILDLGCGRGDVMRYCLQQGAESIVGIDFSPAAIALAKETLAGLEGWRLEAGDALEVLPTINEKFDVIIMMDSIEHIPASEIRVILPQLFNLLKADGRIIVNTPYYRRYEDYIGQETFILPSPTDKNPLTKGMHCTKYTQGRLLDLMMEMGFQCLDADIALFKKQEYSPYIVCAFYTENTPYEQEINDLRASLVKLGIKYFFKPMKTLSKWEFNCGMKPAFIKECLLRYNELTIMYTDADSVLVREPEFLRGFDHDIAVHFLGGKELLSGTIVFKSNDRTLALVENWIFEQAASPNTWDQKTLQIVVEKAKLDRVELPLEYIQIFDHKNQTKEPVVIHNQASRRFKGAVTVTGITEVYLPKWLTCWRQLGDGTILILRPNAKIKAYMDENFCPVPGENRWWPIMSDPSVKNYKGLHKGEVVTIIGKGPSLDKLDATKLTGVNIALNEAFNKLQEVATNEVIYGTQLDSWMKAACFPHKGILFCSPRSKVHYPGVQNAKLFDPRFLGISATPASLEFACCLAQYMGAKSLRLVCFDAITNGNCDYAESVGYKPTNMGDPKRFLKHKDLLVKIKLPYELVP